MPVTFNNLKDRIRKQTAKTDLPLLQNVWHVVKYPLDACRATNGAHTELAKGMEKLYELLFTVEWL
jgi:hypothetical protein